MVFNILLALILSQSAFAYSRSGEADKNQPCKDALSSRSGEPDFYAVFNAIAESETISEIAEKFQLGRGAVDRWVFNAVWRDITKDTKVANKVAIGIGVFDPIFVKQDIYREIARMIRESETTSEITGKLRIPVDYLHSLMSKYWIHRWMSIAFSDHWKSKAEGIGSSLGTIISGSKPFSENLQKGFLRTIEKSESLLEIATKLNVPIGALSFALNKYWKEYGWLGSSEQREIPKIEFPNRPPPQWN